MLSAASQKGIPGSSSPWYACLRGSNEKRTRLPATGQRSRPTVCSSKVSLSLDNISSHQPYIHCDGISLETVGESLAWQKLRFAHPCSRSSSTRCSIAACFLWDAYAVRYVLIRKAGLRDRFRRLMVGTTDVETGHRQGGT